MHQLYPECRLFLKDYAFTKSALYVDWNRRPLAEESLQLAAMNVAVLPILFARFGWPMETSEELPWFPEQKWLRKADFHAEIMSRTEGRLELVRKSTAPDFGKEIDFAMPENRKRAVICPTTNDPIPNHPVGYEFNHAKRKENRRNEIRDQKFGVGGKKAIAENADHDQAGAPEGIMIPLRKIPKGAAPKAVPDNPFSREAVPDNPFASSFLEDEDVGAKANPFASSFLDDEEDVVMAEPKNTGASRNPFAASSFVDEENHLAVNNKTGGGASRNLFSTTSSSSFPDRAPGGVSSRGPPEGARGRPPAPAGGKGLFSGGSAPFGGASKGNLFSGGPRPPAPFPGGPGPRPPAPAGGNRFPGDASSSPAAPPGVLPWSHGTGLIIFIVPQKSTLHRFSSFFRNKRDHTFFCQSQTSTIPLSGQCVVFSL